MERPALLRTRIFNLLEHPLDTSLSRWVNYCIIGLIVLNILATVIDSIPELHENYGVYFYGFEVFSVVIFSLEYLARVWSSVDAPEVVGQSAFKARIRYMLRPLICWRCYRFIWACFSRWIYVSCVSSAYYEFLN